MGFCLAIAAVMVVAGGCASPFAKKAPAAPVLDTSLPSSFSVSQTPVKAPEPKSLPPAVNTPIATSTPSAGLATSSNSSAVAVPPPPVNTPPAPPAAPVAQTVSVSIKNFAFDPAQLTIAAGSTVVWTNNDAVAHRLISASFNSPLLLQGQTYTQKFNIAGVFDYSCSIHPSMTGRIIVK